MQNDKMQNGKYKELKGKMAKIRSLKANGKNK